MCWEYFYTGFLVTCRFAAGLYPAVYEKGGSVCLGVSKSGIAYDFKAK
jgi:hypothetical protein